MLFKKEEKQDHQATVMYYPPNVHIAFQAFRVARKRVYLTGNKKRLLTFRHAVDGICEQKRLDLEGSTKERLQLGKMSSSEALKCLNCLPKTSFSPMYRRIKGNIPQHLFVLNRH